MFCSNKWSSLLKAHFKFRIRIITTSVSENEKFHILDNGCPLYSPRFSSVLSFHKVTKDEFQLAAVTDAIRCYHIDVNGSAAYKKRFKRSFGFYNGYSETRKI